jgi:hypothetical protein
MILIRTKPPDATEFQGIVLANTETFVIIQQITDFEANGIVVIAKKWIESVRNGKFEKCANEILRSTVPSESSPRAAPYLGASSWEEIVAALQAADIWPAVEVIYKGEPSFYIGPVTAVSKDSFKLYCYDAAGQWEKEYELDYDEVFKIEIDSKYVKRFNEYMRTKRKPARKRQKVQ